MGTASARAVGLRAPVTSFSKYQTDNNHRIYLKTFRGQIVGLLKAGPKRLLIKNKNGALRELETTCVLDFYVSERFQRSGHGWSLFKVMLRYEGTLPELIAYDRPSPKLLGFLRKHCGLSFPVPQSNNFVFFEKFFSVPRGTQTAAAQESARIRSVFGEGFGESLRSSSADGARSPSLSLSEGSSSVCTGQGGHDVPLLPLSVPLSPLSVPLSPHSVPLSPHSVRSPTALFTSGCPAYSLCLFISLCVRCLGSHLVSHGGSMAAALRETAHCVGRQAAALAGGVAVLTGETAHSSGVRQPPWLVMSLSSQGRQPILSGVRQPPWLVMSLSSQGRQHIRRASGSRPGW